MKTGKIFGWFILVSLFSLAFASLVLAFGSVKALISFIAVIAILGFCILAVILLIAFAVSLIKDES